MYNVISYACETTSTNIDQAVTDRVEGMQTLKLQGVQLQLNHVSKW